jgi:hypothetical protein
MDAGSDLLPAPGPGSDGGVGAPGGDARPGGVRSSGPDSQGGSGGLALAVVVSLLIVCGLALRLWLLGNAPMNSDEGTVGLIAHEILHGHTYAFAWGQQYGGVEPYVLAAAFSVFGQSPFVLDATPAFLGLICAVLVWRIGLRLFSFRAAVTAAVFSFVWSEAALWNSTREYGYHEVCLLLSLVVLLEALRIVQLARQGEGRDRLWEWAVLGAAAGLGFWASPEVVYLALPAAVIVFVSLWGRPVAAVVSRLVVAALVAVPWIWAVLASHSAGLPSSPVSYLTRLRLFFTHVLPMGLGLRVEGAGAWEGGDVIGVLLSVLVAACIVGAAVLLVLRVPDARVLALTVALYPFLYAAFPTSWFWNDGRYAIALSPVCALLIAGGLWQVWREDTASWVASGVLVLAFVSTLVAFNDGYGAIGHPGRLTTFSSDPNPAVTSLAARLERLGISRAYAGYWVANDLTFISNGHVVAAAVGFNRNPPEAARPAGRTPTGWIFVPPQALGTDEGQLGSASNLDPGAVTESGLTSYLSSHGIPYKVVTTDGFDVVVPARPVSPAQLGA